MTNGIPDPQFDPKQDDMRTTAYSNTGTDYSEYHYQPMRPAPKKRRGPVVLVSLLFAAGFFTAGLLYSMLVSQQANRPLTNNEVQEHLVISAISESGLTTAEIAEKALPSVVGINIYSASQVSAIGEASGIILDTNGYIITNAHVVEDAAAVTVVFDDGTEVNAGVVGSDTRTDLAVVKIDPEGLELIPAEFGDSTLCRLGDDVVAIGNAGGFYNSVTRGVISGLNREVSSSIGINLIQTDAAINPGNSGGALLNSGGQVIGINSSKIIGSEIDSMGFAIPISEAKPIIDQLISYGQVTDRVVLGITIVALNQTTGSMYGLPEQGLYITQIDQASNLFAAGVTRGDVLLSANGTTLMENDDLLRLLEECVPGDEMTFEVSRSDGSETTVTIVLQGADAFPSQQS